MKKTDSTNSIFRILEHPDGWVVCLGEYILTTPKETREEAEREININDWGFVISVVSAAQHLNNEWEKQKTEILNTTNN